MNEEQTIQALRNRVRDDVYTDTDKVLKRLLQFDLDALVNKHAYAMLQDYDKLSVNRVKLNTRLKALLNLVDDYLAKAA